MRRTGSSIADEELRHVGGADGIPHGRKLQSIANHTQQGFVLIEGIRDVLLLDFGSNEDGEHVPATIFRVQLYRRAIWLALRSARRVTPSVCSDGSMADIVLR